MVFVLCMYIIAQMFLNCKHLFVFLEKIFYFSFFTKLWRVFQCLFIIRSQFVRIVYLYSTGRAPQPDRRSTFIPPPQATPQLGKASVTQPRLFLLFAFCKLKAKMNHNSRCAPMLFCQKRSSGLCFCDFSQKYANPKNEFLQRGTCILRFIIVK